MNVYTAKQLGELLGKSEQWVNSRARTKQWPHLLVGKSVRFTEAHVEAVLDLLSVQPTAQAVAANSWARKTRGGAR